MIGDWNAFTPGCTRESLAWPHPPPKPQLPAVVAGNSVEPCDERTSGRPGPSRPSNGNAGQKGPKRLLDDKDFWKIYEKGETIGRGHFAIKLVRHRSRRDLRPPALNRGPRPSRPVRECGTRGPAHPCARKPPPATLATRGPPRAQTASQNVAASTTPVTPATVGSGAFWRPDKGLEEHKEDHER